LWRIYLGLKVVLPLDLDSHSHKSQKMRSKNYFITINVFDENTELFLQEGLLGTKYLSYCYEIAPTTGRPHLHVYVVFDNQRHLTAIRKLFPNSDVQIAKSDYINEGITYIRKNGNFYERGTKPLSPVEKGDSEKQRWINAKACALRGDFDSIPADLYTRYRSTYKRMRIEDGPTPQPLETSRFYGVWIWGPPGVGKSHQARDKYSPHYLKSRTKWWDNYISGYYVIMEEYEPKDSMELTSYVKMWADKWPFCAETKGGTVTLRPPKIIITSNYSIDQCFHGVDAEAIERRFEVIHITELNEVAISFNSSHTAM